MTPDVAAGVALVAAGVAGLVAGFAVTWVALRRRENADLPASVADGIDDLARVARAAGVWVEDEPSLAGHIWMDSPDDSPPYTDLSTWKPVTVRLVEDERTVRDDAG